MKLLFDASWFHFGGIGRYAKEISKKLKSIRYFEFSNPFSPFVSIKIAFSMIKNREDFYFLPGYIPPLFIRKRYIFTIHDLNHIDVSHNSNFFKRLFYSYVIKPGCHNASKIFTVSYFSKSRIVEWSGVSAEKVIIVGNGVDERYKPLNGLRNKVSRYGEYFLCVSNRKKHKNEIRVIDAFLNSVASDEINLVFTGKPDKFILNYIETHNSCDRIIFTGFLEEEELVELYQLSLGLLFPSLYEGFGLPVIEAMACGVPVITSNTTSLIEVAGDAALLVNPLCTEQITENINRLLNDDDLRDSLIQKGLVQASNYTWEKTVNIVKDELEKCMREM